MIIQLLILLLVIGVVYWIITIIPGPPMVKTIGYVILAIIALVYGLKLLGVTLP